MGIHLENAYKIEGWMSNLELEWLAKTAKGKQVIIEFGCYLGRSTRAIVDNTKGLVFAVDPWDGKYYNKDGQEIQILKVNAYERFRNNLSDVIALGQVEVLRCKSYEFPDFGEGIADFVFIDADHRYSEVKKDIEIAERLVKFGGVIAGHDYAHPDWPGVKQAVDEIYPHAQICESIWWVTKNRKS